MTTIRERREQYEQDMMARRERQKAESAASPKGEWEIMPFIGVMGALLALVGMGLFAWQCYFWLAWGIWQYVSILDLLSWLSDLPFRDVTTGWLGLDKLLGWLPASLTAIIVGSVIAALCDAERFAP